MYGVVLVGLFRDIVFLLLFLGVLRGSLVLGTLRLRVFYVVHYLLQLVHGQFLEEVLVDSPLHPLFLLLPSLVDHFEPKNFHILEKRRLPRLPDFGLDQSVFILDGNLLELFDALDRSGPVADCDWEGVEEVVASLSNQLVNDLLHIFHLFLLFELKVENIIAEDKGKGLLAEDLDFLDFPKHSTVQQHPVFQLKHHLVLFEGEKTVQLVWDGLDV